MNERAYTLIEDMAPLPGESFHALRKRHREFNRGLLPPPPPIKFGKSFDRTYRADLADCKNDPDAYVSGPRALEKLKEKRKRQGWTLGKPGSAADVNASANKEIGPMKSLQECLAQVQAENPGL